MADSIAKGLLIPLLKKPTSDPTVPKNYRPIVVSTTFSKLLEIHILSMCGEHEFHDLQFGFVGSRGTSMAVSLTHDVIDYCVSRGSAVYVCALDAEGAFDGIPHSIMFAKAMNVIPALYWRLLIYWYSRLTVYIRWGEQTSDAINIRKGTRQGGLSSPFIFNLLYQDVVAKLSGMPCGIAINSVTYNLCCYADDLLLCSLTVSGLQRLIDEANSYITSHGLRFNPAKTKCVTFGKSPYNDRKWSLDDVTLDEADHVVHLGVILANDTKSHTKARIKSARRAFYALQGAGLCVNGTSSDTITHIYTTAIRPVLLYGLECIYQCKTVINDAERLQSKLLKSALGLKKYSRTSPLLQALKIQRISKSAKIQELVLFKSMFLSSSRTYQFYKYILSQHMLGVKYSHKSIVARVLNTCNENDISLIKYLCDDSYLKSKKFAMKRFPADGVADSVAFLFSQSSSQTMINCLLQPF